MPPSWETFYLAILVNEKRNRLGSFVSFITQQKLSYQEAKQVRLDNTEGFLVVDETSSVK